MVSFANAAINQEINYQGKLVNASGVTVPDGTYNMRFKLYSTATGGTSLWSEDRTSANKVQVTKGLFSVMLGSVTSLSSVDFNQTLYLGVEIGGTGTPVWDGEMSPRKKLGSVTSAFNSDKLDGLDSTAFAQLAGLNTFTGTNTFATTTISNLTATILSAVTGTFTNLFATTGDFTTLNATTTNASTSNVTGNGYFGGNVGIGTSTPAAALHVLGSIRLDSTNGTSSAYSVIQSFQGIAFVGWNGTDQAAKLEANSNKDVLLKTTTGNLTLKGVSGNVGIGTTTPLSKLTAYGDLFLEGASRYLNFGTTVGTTGYGIRDNAGNLEFKNSGGNWGGLVSTSATNTWTAAQNFTSTYASTTYATTTNTTGLTTTGNLVVVASSTLSTTTISNLTASIVSVIDSIFASTGNFTTLNTSTTNASTSNVTGNGYFGGNVGIGENAPSTKLDVNGDFSLVLADDYNTSGTQNNVAIAGSNNNYSTVRYSGSAAATFTGITGGQNGKLLYIHNGSNYALTLKNQSVSSSAANRIITGTNADLVVNAGAAIALQYDVRDSRWRVIGGVGSSGGSGSSGPAFSVNKGGTNQTVTTSTFTQLTWSTEVFDTNNNFNTVSGGFTPTVPGKYIVTLNVTCADNTGQCQSHIRKNGVSISTTEADVAGTHNTFSSVVVDMNGSTDFLDATVYNGGGTVIIGAASYTNFTGALLAPINSNNAAGWANDGTQSYLLDTADKVAIGKTAASTTLDINGNLAMNSGADYTTTGSQNDVSLGEYSNIRYNGASTATFTGISGGTNGEILYIHNASNYTLTLSNQSASSVAANRIITGTNADLAVSSNSSIVMQYDLAATRWRVIGGTGSGGGQVGTGGPSFSVNRNGVDQSIPTGTLTLIDFTTETFDTNNNFDTTTDRFTPTVPGKYVLTAQAQFGDILSSGIYAWIRIRKNGVIVAGNVVYAAAFNGYSNPTVTTVVDANGSTDYFDVTIEHINGNSRNIVGIVDRTYFSGALLAPIQGSATFSGLTNAAATNTLDNGLFAQIWNWTTATTQNLLTMVANALTTGSILSLTSSSASLNSTNGLLYVANTGTSTSGIVAKLQSNGTAGSGLTVLANGNIGIGTTSALALLHIEGTGAEFGRFGRSDAAGGAWMSFTRANNIRTYLGYEGTTGGGILSGSLANSTVLRSEGALHLVSNGGSATNGITISTTGNVGIGTTGPSAALHVAAQPNTRAFYIDGASMGTNAGFGIFGGGGALTGIGWRGQIIGNNFNLPSTNIPTVNGGTAGYAKAYGISFASEDTTDTGMGFWSGTGAGTQMTEKMRITNSGNVGIGTLSPGAKLSVLGNIVIGANSAAFSEQLSLQSALDTPLYSLIRNTNSGSSAYSGYYLNAYGYSWGMRTGSTNANNNNFQITSDILGTPVDRLTINTSGNVGIGTTIPSQKLTVLGDIRIGTSGSNGCLQNFAGTALTGTCSSDESLKTNIVSLDTASITTRLLNVNFVSYNWNDLASELYAKHKDQKAIGVIAQNVEKQFPELVTQDDKGYKVVDLTTLQWYVMSAVKEIISMLEKMKEEIITKRLRTDMLCVGGECITAEELRQLKASANMQRNSPLPTSPVPENPIPTQTDVGTTTQETATSTPPTDTETIPPTEPTEQVLVPVTEPVVEPTTEPSV